MTYITIKTKETNANIEIFPSIVLNEGSHISLADIEIPEEVTKSFTFTGHQAISGGLIRDSQPAMMTFPVRITYLNYNLWLRIILCTKILVLLLKQ